MSKEGEKEIIIMVFRINGGIGNFSENSSYNN